MNTEEQIQNLINALPEGKRTDMTALHELILNALPGSKLWFDGGIGEDNRVINNPTIGYGNLTMKYANGSTKEVFRIGLSPNKTGVSVYILGLKDKNYLKENFGDKIGKASVTGYCIKFKALKDVNLDVLATAIRYGGEQE